MTDPFKQKRTHLWKNKFEIYWCDLCQCFSLKCPDCGGTMCSQDCCASCRDEFDKFLSEVKASEFDYLSTEERNTVERADRIRDLLLICLAAGLKEIDWKFLIDNGELSNYDLKIFNDKIN